MHISHKQVLCLLSHKNHIETAISILTEYKIIIFAYKLVKKISTREFNTIHMNKTGSGFITFLVSIILVSFSFSGFSQNELMIFGTVSIPDNPDARARLKVENTETYRTVYELWLETDGRYRVDLPYGQNYKIFFYAEGNTTMVFDVILKLPPHVRQCCYRPIPLSFHFFKPDGIHDKLFSDVFYSIRYEERLRGFNHDIDVDYMVQQRIVNHAIFSAQLQEAREGNQLRDQVVLEEKKYLALINQATDLYNSKHFYASRRVFTEALKIRPDRMYPQYKLEDIRTELERFENRAALLGVNVDSLMQQELALIIAEAGVDEDYYPPYIPLTQADIERIFKQEVEKQIQIMASTPQEANRLLGLMQEFFKDAPSTDMITDTKPQTVEEPAARIVDFTRPSTREPEITPEVVESITDTPIIETIPAEIIEIHEPIVETEKPTVTPSPVTPPTERPVVRTPQTKEEIKVVDFATYQDSLRRRYPEERTVEYTEDAHRKTTRVILNDGKFVEIFVRVEHSWGATYYYIEEYPSGYQSIGYSAFMNRTRLYELEEKR